MQTVSGGTAGAAAFGEIGLGHDAPLGHAATRHAAGPTFPREPRTFSQETAACNESVPAPLPTSAPSHPSYTIGRAPRVDRLAVSAFGGAAAGSLADEPRPRCVASKAAAGVSFGSSSAASGRTLEGGVATSAPLGPAELPASLVPHKPAARFGSAAARPVRPAPEWQLREGAPELEPSIDAVKPRAATVIIAPPVHEAAAAGDGDGDGREAAPGPGFYEPSLELVTRRAAGVRMVKPTQALD